MSIATLPPTPQRTDSPDVFVAKSDAFIAALPQFVSDANLLAANLNSIASGGAYTIPYTYAGNSTSNGVANVVGFYPNGASATTATSIQVDMTTAAQNITALVQSMATSTSQVKGTLRLVKAGDTSKWAVFNVTSYTQSTGAYGAFSVTPVTQSSASPFAANDSLILQFQRTGDMGTTGTLARRTASTTTVGTTTPDMNSVDMYIITAQASSLTLGTPTGTLSDGRQLMYRIKDNGTAQTLAYTGVYRAPTELAFPSATVAGKTTYLGFVYNATDAKWDLVAAISNM